MRMLLIFSIVGLVLSGCSSTPQQNPWHDQVIETEAATTSVDCGSRPMPSEIIGADNVLYDQAAFNRLDQYLNCMDANVGIADDNAAAIDELKQVRKELVRAGVAQYNISEMRETMLEDERKHHFWQSLGYWILIIGAVAL